MRDIDALKWSVGGGVGAGAALSLFWASAGLLDRLAKAPRVALTFKLVALAGLVALMVAVGTLEWAMNKVVASAPTPEAAREAENISKTAEYALYPSYVASVAAILALFLYTNDFGIDDSINWMLILPLFLFGAGVVGQPIAFSILLSKVETYQTNHLSS